MASASPIIRIAPTVVVKLRFADSTEATNQRVARSLVDPKLVLIPEVHRWFEYEGMKYLVMDYIEGKHFKDVDPEDAGRRMAKIFEHFNTIKGECGSLDPAWQSYPRGAIWSHNYWGRIPKSVEDVEQFFNDRLDNPRLKKPEKLVLSRRDCVLCHLDLAERNVLFLDDGRLALLDWFSAGFYPQAVDLTVLMVLQGSVRDIGLAGHTYKELKKTDLMNEEEMRLIHRGYDLGWHCSYVVPCRNSKVQLTAAVDRLFRDQPLDLHPKR